MITTTSNLKANNTNVVNYFKPNNNPVVENYIQKINEVLNFNDKEMPLAERLVTEVRVLASKQKCNFKEILYSIECMIINYLTGQNFFNEKNIAVKLKFDLTIIELNDLTKQTMSIENELINYIQKFPGMIRNSLHYKETIKSLYNQVIQVEKNLYLNMNPKKLLLVDLVKAVKIVKEYNKLTDKKNFLDQHIFNFNRYLAQVEESQINITGFIDEIFSATSIKTAMFFSHVYDKIIDVLERVKQKKNSSLKSYLFDYEYKCHEHSLLKNILEEKKEYIQLTNTIYATLYDIDKQLLDQISIPKQKLEVMRYAMAKK